MYRRYQSLLFFAVIFILLNPTISKASTNYIASGRLYFYNYDNALNPIRFARIVLYEINGTTKREVCRTYTTYIGEFSCRFTWNEADGPDIQYFVFATDDRSVYVANDNEVADRESITYLAEGPIIYNYQYPEIEFPNSIMPRNSDINTAFLIYSQIAYNARYYLTNYWGWTNNFNDLRVYWKRSNNLGSFYDDSIHLITIDNSHSKEPDIILHEYGHYVIHKLYGVEYFIASPCSWARDLHPQCGLAEGFPTYMQAVIQGQQDYVGTFNGMVGSV